MTNLKPVIGLYLSPFINSNPQSKFNMLSQNNYISLTYYALKIIAVFRKQVLINSVIFIIILLYFIKFNILSLFFTFILLVFLIFNISIFSIANKINTSREVKDTLLNIKNIENIK